jgi:gallate decarboxylase subunit D
MDRIADNIDGFRLSETSDKLTVNAEVFSLGADLLIIIHGGRSHVGAIGIGLPRPSLRDPDKISASSSVFTFLGHKEDGLAKSMSERLAAGLNRKVVVVAGIHWDNLKTEEIATVGELCERITKKILMEGENK